VNNSIFHRLINQYQRGDAVKKHWVLMISFALFFLLFIQAITVFIESIYILELLSTSLDEKVLGVLFLFSPVFLFLFGRKVPRWLLWASFALFLVGRGMIPYLDTSSRMVAAGVASAAGLILLPLMLVSYRNQDAGLPRAWAWQLAYLCSCAH
jgi:hypothetical protein